MVPVFAAKLKEIRNLRNLTQQELAEELYVSQAVVSLWETGEIQPNLDHLVALTKVLKCSADDLLGL